MTPTRHPIIDAFLVRFWNSSGNIDRTAGGLQVGCDVAAPGPRVADFLQPIPQGGAILSKIIKQKHAKTGGLRDLARLEPLAPRFFIVFAKNPSATVSQAPIKTRTIQPVHDFFQPSSYQQFVCSTLNGQRSWKQICR